MSKHSTFVRNLSLLLSLVLLTGTPLRAQKAPVLLDSANLFPNAGPSALFGNAASAVAAGDPYVPRALSCSINVACREGRGWSDAIKATVRIVRKDNEISCTGVLLNNTLEDKTPYVLTAQHCGRPAVGQHIDWEFQFDYQSPSCNNPPRMPKPQSVWGATVVAAYGGANDFALLKLSQPIPANLDVTFAGWSLVDQVPANSTVIGHPQQDIKKITLEDDPLIDAVSFWVATFDHGTIEAGSSGAPLFNEHQQVIGLVRSALRMDSQACSGPGGDDNGAMILFPKLSANWHIGPAGERLSDFLDPTGNAQSLGALHAHSFEVHRGDNTLLSEASDTTQETHAPTHTWGPAYPNPFNPQTRISLSVAQRQRVAVDVFDVTGRRVTTLFEGAMDAGTPYAFTFEAGSLPSGVYLIHAAGETFVGTQTVTLFK